MTRPPAVLHQVDDKNRLDRNEDDESEPKDEVQNGVDLRAPRCEIRRSPPKIICPRLGKSARKADKNR
jgi:hypothetical protein